MPGDTGDGTGIESARQAAADGDVASQAEANGVGQEFAELCKHRALVRDFRHGYRSNAPVAPRPTRKRVHIDFHCLAWQKLLHRREDRVPVSIETRTGVLRCPREAPLIYVERESRVLQEPLVLGSKSEEIAAKTKQERFFPVSVPRAKENSAHLIVESERKHPVETRETCHAPMLVSLQQDLRVGLRPKRHAESLQFVADFEVVVDLAIVGHDVAPIDVGHRLRAVRRKVEDCQPAMSQDHVDATGPNAMTIWTAMGHLGQHSLDTPRLVRPGTDHSGDAAHSVLRPARELKPSHEGSHVSWRLPASSLARL